MGDTQAPGDSGPFPERIESGGAVFERVPDQVYLVLPDVADAGRVAELVDRFGLAPVLPDADRERLAEIEEEIAPRLWLRSTSGNDLAGLILELRASDEVAVASPVFRQPVVPMLNGQAFANDLLVRFHPGVVERDAREVIEELGATIQSVFPEARSGDLYHLAIDPARGDALETAAAAASFENVRTARVNWIQLQRPFSGVAPDDPHFGQQWNLARIGAPAGWDLSQGTDDVVIAIVDSGCELDHEDLANKFVPRTDWHDTVRGGGDPRDMDGHGTMVAGLTAAETDNSIGVAGVAPACRIMPIRMYLSSVFDEADIVSAIRWARLHGARVINMSWYYLPDHADADIELDGAHADGIALVAASGNCWERDGCDDAFGVLWPATNPHVMAVGATDDQDRRKQRSAADPLPWDSRYGAELSVMAPSPIPWTTRRQGSYGDFSGTSAAAPQVAGLMALVVSALLAGGADGSGVNDAARSIVESTAAKAGGYAYASDAAHPNGSWHEEMGYGLIDAAAALARARER